MVTCRGLGFHHPKGFIATIGRLLSRDKTTNSCQDGLEEDGNRELGGVIFRDIWLKCRDGSIQWSKFLLAANSPLLRVSLSETAAEDGCDVILLPDMSVSTVTSMLACTVNPAVRNDTLSVNEQEVMSLLGFHLFNISSKVTATVTSQQPPPLPPPPSTSTEKKLADRELNTPTLDSVDELTMSSSSEEEEESTPPSSPVKRPPSPGSLVCPECGVKFQRLLHLQRHLASHEETCQIQCEQCEKVFYHPDNLKLHQKYHLDKAKTISCAQCGENVQGSRALKSHQERMHSPKISCSVCSKTFSSRRLLRRHQVRIHETPPPDEDTFFCHVCGKDFASAQAMVVHKRSHSVGAASSAADGSKKKVIKPEYVHCPDCNKLFASPRHLNLHVKRTHQTEATQCQHCDKSVKDLKKHMVACHPDGTQGPPHASQPPPERNSVACKYCDKTFSSKYVMSAHVKREHESKRDFKCSACDRTFVTNASLRRHAREAHGENSFECGDCGLFFPVRHSLERHVKHVHNPVKVQCPKCKLSVVHLDSHLATVHKLSPGDSRTVMDNLTGKSAARTDLPYTHRAGQQ